MKHIQNAFPDEALPPSSTDRMSVVVTPYKTAHIGNVCSIQGCRLLVLGMTVRDTLSLMN